MRTIVDLSDASVAALTELARKEGVSRTELVRRAVARYLAERAVDESADAFGSWAERRLDALEFEDELRGRRDAPSRTRRSVSTRPARRPRSRR